MQFNFKPIDLICDSINQCVYDNLTKEEATVKIQNWYKEVVLNNISVVYKELEETITIEQFNASMDIDKVVKEACLVGKSGNIVKDNYDILFSMLFQN